MVQEAWDGQIDWSYSGWEYIEGVGMAACQSHDLLREGNSVSYYAPGQNALPEGDNLVLAHADAALAMPSGCSVPVLDDIICEVDWAGNPTSFPVWRAVDHQDEFSLDEAALAEICTAGGGYWLHINAVSRLGPNHWYEEGDSRFHPDHLILDSRHAGFLAIIDHLTGEVLWRGSARIIRRGSLGTPYSPSSVSILPI